jgi:CheY-like chemotaxis protein
LDSQGTQSRFARGRFLVLVVDDNQDDADTLCMLLRMWGYDCRVAYDGAAGLRLACDFRPDCLLLDIAMPGMDGYALARKVREQPGLRHAKLVALTAYSDETHLQRSRDAGFDFLLTKTAEPSQVERLLDMLSRVVRFTDKSEEMDRQEVEEAEDEEREVRGARAVNCPEYGVLVSCCARG